MAYKSFYFVNISKYQMALSQIFNRIGQLGVGLTLTGGILNSALYNVDGGRRAVIFDRFQGTYLPNSSNSFTLFENHSKMSHLNIGISTNFCPIKTDLSGNIVGPQA